MSYFGNYQSIMKYILRLFNIMNLGIQRFLFVISLIFPFAFVEIFGNGGMNRVINRILEFDIYAILTLPSIFIFFWIGIFILLWIIEGFKIKNKHS